MIRRLLFETSTSDPAITVSASLLLLVVSMAAALIPALRAASTDPIETLRAP